MALISIQDSLGNYIDLPTPSVGGYECPPNEITKSSRNTLGNLYKYRINVKRSINITWNAVTPSQKATILSLTSGNSFQVKYFDIQEGTYRYGKFYRGSDLKVIPHPPFKNDEFHHYEITMSLTEF